ncbi:putative nuclease HARBI1 [Pleurodeles waltl]|uniref:putative nuclease HARBI1 n=1 Tax=Pleurodeles waltl TaxID=8319 RepID=UPI0037099B0A
MSQLMFSLILRDVLSAMLNHLDTYIQFPQREDLANGTAGFYGFAHLPQVAEAVDGTHVASVPPHANEQVYQNRKNFHSVNVQVVCLVDLYILHVFALYLGSAHDSFTMQDSTILQLMSQLRPERAWLFGDSAYPNCLWLLTPLRNPTMPGEVHFNEAHGRTRQDVQRAFGLLKARFQSLDWTGGALLYSPGKVCQISVACCMLHNLALRRDIPYIPEERDPAVPPGETPEIQSEDESGEEEGADLREDVINSCSSAQAGEGDRAQPSGEASDHKTTGQDTTDTE